MYVFEKLHEKRHKDVPISIVLAPQVGFEPTTYRLTAECSTVELLRLTS